MEKINEPLIFSKLQKTFRVEGAKSSSSWPASAKARHALGIKMHALDILIWESFYETS